MLFFENLNITGNPLAKLVSVKRGEDGKFQCPKRIQSNRKSKASVCNNDLNL
jgi:hypothetical protein